MIDLDKIPDVIQDQVKNDIQRYGEWAKSHYLYLAPFGKMLQNLKSSDSEFVWFIVTLHLINLYGSQDPSPIHFTTAREFLTELKIDNDKAVDLLARELVIECQHLKKFLFETFEVYDMSILKNNQIIAKLSDESGWLLPEKNAQPDFISIKNNCNAVDFFFSEFLRNKGKRGQELSTFIYESSLSRHRKYFNSNFSSELRHETWAIWIPKEKSIFSPFLIILADVLWNDKCKIRWDREKKNVPALPQAVLVKTIKPPLTRDSRIEIDDNKNITCYSENGNIISTVPCVDPRLVNLICRGMECLSSLNGHKLIRWQVKTGFNSWVNGSEDPRLICTNGGYEGIANLIGSSSSNKAITEVKAMLHAQAYGQFRLPNGDAGNMIILREIEKYRNGEPSKINIILGEFLLPNFTHLLPQGEKRRLVPITDLPPLIGSKNTHAAQAMFQLLILEEFSKQSDRFATKGSILLNSQKLEELAYQAKLPKTSLNKVIEGWTQDDFFSMAFLEKSEDEYTLGKKYSNVIDFLETQGKQRIDGSKGGEKSAAAKKAFIKKYVKNKKN